MKLVFFTFPSSYQAEEPIVLKSEQEEFELNDALVEDSNNELSYEEIKREPSPADGNSITESMKCYFMDNYGIYINDYL